MSTSSDLKLSRAVQSRSIFPKLFTSQTSTRPHKYLGWAKPPENTFLSLNPKLMVKLLLGVPVPSSCVITVSVFQPL